MNISSHIPPDSQLNFKLQKRPYQKAEYMITKRPYCKLIPFKAIFFAHNHEQLFCCTRLYFSNHHKILAFQGSFKILGTAKSHEAECSEQEVVWLVKYCVALNVLHKQSRADKKICHGNFATCWNHFCSNASWWHPNTCKQTYVSSPDLILSKTSSLTCGHWSKSEVTDKHFYSS